MRNPTDAACDDTGVVLTVAYIARLHRETCELLEVSRRLRKRALIVKLRFCDAAKLSEEMMSKARQIRSALSR